MLEGRDADAIGLIARNEILAENHAWRQERTDEKRQGFISTFFLKRYTMSVKRRSGGGVRARNHWFSWHSVDA
jgi:hypothetical protein